MLELIKKIREATGAGVIEVKKALDESDGNETKALEIIRRRGLEKADKKGDRLAKEGVVGFYVHTNNKVAALVKVFCETDFVARNNEFLDFSRDLAMQVVAMKPISVRPEDVPAELVAAQNEEWLRQLSGEKKPEEIKRKILEGKEKKFRSENALLSQSFIKDPDRTVEETLKGKISVIGENIVVDSFVRLEL